MKNRRRPRVLVLERSRHGYGRASQSKIAFIEKHIGKIAELSRLLVHHLYPARETAEQIVTLTRSADDDGASYLLSRDKTLTAAYLQAYDTDVQKLRDVLIQAAALSD